MKSTPSNLMGLPAEVVAVLNYKKSAATLGTHISCHPSMYGNVVLQTSFAMNTALENKSFYKASS